MTIVTCYLQCIFICLTVHLKVWTALLSHMPLLALIKNINHLGSLGLLESSSTSLQTVIDKLGNEQHLHDAKYVTDYYNCNNNYWYLLCHSVVKLLCF